MSSSSIFKYRPDIDGLRAIAVLAVVLYHFGVASLSGGFVGVDVFFVISGYLITGIIQREIEQNRFTFAGFYERRIRRIFPALFVVLLSTFLVGLYILLPSDLMMLGKSTAATLLFTSNVFFWRTSGYFDSSSELNPLLHTWSLAVEEQFYIGLPIILMIVARYARSYIKPILICSAVLSWFACMYVQALRPTATFYLLPFRAWELLIGAYLAVAGLPTLKNKLNTCLAWLGLATLLASFLWIKAGPQFPGWQALIPVLATAVLIYTGTVTASPVSTILSWRPLVFVGLISYSLYLWHWPVLVYAKYLNALEPLGAWLWAGIALSLLLATASYYWIETPFREHKKIFTRKRLFIGALTTSVVLALVGGLVWRSEGWPNRFSAEVVALDKIRGSSRPFQECNGRFIIANTINASCVLGDKSVSPVMVIWGDSHALAWAPVFDKLLQKKKISALLAFTDSCPPLLDGYIDNKDCMSGNEMARKFIENNAKISTVVLSSKWSYYEGEVDFKLIHTIDSKTGKIISFADAMNGTMQWLNHNSKKIWLIGPTPYTSKNMIQDMIKSYETSQRFNPPINMYKNAIIRQNLFEQSVDRRLVDVYSKPIFWLCSQNECQYEVKGIPFFRDQHHLSAQGSLMLMPQLETDFNKLVIIGGKNER